VDEAQVADYLHHLIKKRHSGPCTLDTSVNDCINRCLNAYPTVPPAADLTGASGCCYCDTYDGSGTCLPFYRDGPCCSNNSTTTCLPPCPLLHIHGHGVTDHVCCSDTSGVPCVVCPGGRSLCRNICESTLRDLNDICGGAPPPPTTTRLTTTTRPTTIRPTTTRSTTTVNARCNAICVGRRRIPLANCPSCRSGAPYYGNGYYCCGGNIGPSCGGRFTSDADACACRGTGTTVNDDCVAYDAGCGYFGNVDFDSTCGCFYCAK